MEKKTQLIPQSSANPFADSQARSYSGDRILAEFCPISKYWSLFNEQHEILVGTRGCGKTILLKMMRYSMLSQLSDPRAKKLAGEKKFISFYVPLHLEYIKKLSNSNLSKKEKISWFRFSFNCLLAQSVIIEIKEILKDLIEDDLERVKMEYNLSKQINDCWAIEPETPVFKFVKLREKVDKLYYSTDPTKEGLSNTPSLFSHSLASSLSSIRNILCEKFNISPTWIVCIDEADFADECYQECINTSFRSDTDRIVFKVATLHFHHRTKATIDDEINIMDGQDFKYTVIDMKYDEPDFIRVTNWLVKTRLIQEGIIINEVSDFLKTLGDDDYLDYYLKEMKLGKNSRELLEQDILSQLSEESKIHNCKKTSNEIRKTVIDKLAPIFYLREMYKLSKKGAYIPGWYAGAKMVRRIAQGNPRLFIRIMNRLFDEAKGRKIPLDVKKQHECMMDFSKSFCAETQTLERFGPKAQKQLDYIADVIQKKTHKTELAQAGISFIFSKDIDISKHEDWIKKAVAFSRLMIDDRSLLTQISSNTVFHLSYVYAAAFWLPMRKHSSPYIISVLEDVNMTYPVNTVKKQGTSKGKQDSDEKNFLFPYGDI